MWKELNRIKGVWEKTVIDVVWRSLLESKKQRKGKRVKKKRKKEEGRERRKNKKNSGI